MRNYWNNKVVLVTGGSTGLGEMIARVFAERRARVVIAARDALRLHAAEREMQENGLDVHGIAADVTSQCQVDRLFEEIRRRYGRLDVLVNNVGRSARGEVLATAPEDFQQLWEINFLSVVRCTRAAAALLKKTKGHLVNIGSLAAKTASQYMGAYPATKFAMAAYSQQLRHELRGCGVHVLLVCPGPIARDDAGGRYRDGGQQLPESAHKPGAGVKLNRLSPRVLAEEIVAACRRRKPELVTPWKARVLFVLSSLWPSLGDWILRRMT